MIQNIIQAFEKFMSQHGTHYHEFYVGIAANPADRLINGHRVNENIPHIYWNTALHTDIVREIEKYFLEKGTRGGPGGGSMETRFIYAYKVSRDTAE